MPPNENATGQASAESLPLTEAGIYNYVHSHAIETPDAFREIAETFTQPSLPGFECPYTGTEANGKSRHLQRETTGTGEAPSAPPASGKARGDYPLALEKSRAQSLKSFDAPHTVAEAFGTGDVISSILPRYIKGDLPSFNIVGAVIRCPSDFAKLTWTLRTPYMEVLKVAFLNHNGKVVHSATLSVGCINSALIHPQMILRQIEKIAGKTKARRVILSHNHPSGQPAPSADDIRSTQVMLESLQAAGIELVDHVITNGKTFSSWKLGWGIETVQMPQPEWEIIPRQELLRIEQPETLNKIVATLRQADPGHDHVIYGDCKLQIAAVERLPSSLSVEDLAQRIARGSGREGAQHVWFESARRDAVQIRELNEILGKIEIKMLDASTPATPSFKNAALMEVDPRLPADTCASKHTDTHRAKILGEMRIPLRSGGSHRKGAEVEP